MAEKGRPAASSGNTYQDLRVVHCLIDLLQDDSNVSVSVETLDPVDDIVIRGVNRPTRYEQVKERAPGGRWTAGRLCSEGIIDQFVRQQDADADGALVLFTGSDASAFRELVERAQSASANDPGDSTRRTTAIEEWDRRIAAEHRSFASQLVEHVRRCRSTFGLRDLFEVVSRVSVSDSAGSAAQLRQRAIERLEPLVDDPIRACEILERLASDAALRRGTISRRIIECALQDGGSGPRYGAFALHVDWQAYAGDILEQLRSIDAAKLPDLAPTLHTSFGVFNSTIVLGTWLLIGGHGAGKSRLASQLAISTIESGRGCLRVLLAGWATNFAELVLAELSRAARRQATMSDLERVLRAGCALVLDGLDEVPVEERPAAGRQILQFADRHPDLALLLTSRPGFPAALSDRWPIVAIKPLGDDQIEKGLGRELRGLRLSPAVTALAGNPLMLGLLARQLEAGDSPEDEGDLLDAFVDGICKRQATRSPGIDATSGSRLLEDAAFEWLSAGRVALLRSELRVVSAGVARMLASENFLHTDATQVERWVIEGGLAVLVGDLAFPVHRTLLDHLAGRSMGRRNPAAVTLHSELREAVARYLGSTREINDKVLELLMTVGRDVELLGRAKRLSVRGVRWPYGPERFAREYLGQVRRLAEGPLAGIGILDQPMHVTIDRDTTWIEESAASGPRDSVKVVEAANRPETVSSDGSRHPVMAFRTEGYRGAEVDIAVPHFAALTRVAEELTDRVKAARFEHEGPDITYERLCEVARRFVRTVTLWGTIPYEELSAGDFRQLTAEGLYQRFTRFVQERAGRSIPSSALSLVEIRPVPQSKGWAFRLCPEDRLALTLTSAVHGAPLLRLVAKARELGIELLPLHGLGLLPASAEDPILGLPGHLHRLSSEELSLFVMRHEYGQMRAIRFLVDNNLAGVRGLLQKYTSLPWRIELSVENQSTSDTFDVSIRSRTTMNATHDEVILISSDQLAATEANGWSSIHAYRGVLEGAYRTVERDLDSVFRADESLGSSTL